MEHVVNHVFPEDSHIRVLDLFSAAAGGWSLGMHRAGFTTIAACEVIDWRRALYSENNPGVPIYDDVTTLTAERLIRDGVGLPDIVVGSPPCQDISSANTKGKGVDGERSGLYFEAIRLVDECRPRWFAFENSANLRTRGADRVIDALAAIGYTCWPFVVSAGDVGANHERKRSWLIGFRIADADGIGRQDGRSGRRSGFDIPVQNDSRDANKAISAQVRNISGGQSADYRRGDAGHTTEDGCRPGRERGCAVSVEGLCVEACGDGAHAPEERQQGFSGSDQQRTTEVAERSDILARSEMGGSSTDCGAVAEPWADWNGGLAHHLRVDDGLSSWVAQSRIAVGGPKGTVAASLIVEAFGDAVCPQIPEAIGRAIIRVERALAAITQNEKPAAANNNDNDGVRDEKRNEKSAA